MQRVPAPSAEWPQRSAVGALSLRLRAPLRRFFEKRIGSRSEVDDLVQEVFVRLAARTTDAAPVDQLDAYVFRTAANLLKDRFRRQASHAAGAHESYDEDLHGAAIDYPGPERAVIDGQALERLVTALYELPERTRAVFALYHFEDLPHGAIAQCLGIAVSTIEKHMARANAHLLERLADVR